MRHPPFRRLVAGLGSLFLAAGVLSGIGVLTQVATSAPAGAAPTQAADCTFNGVANQLTTGLLVPFDLGTVTPGTTAITIQCTGITPGATYLVGVASPLAGFNTKSTTSTLAADMFMANGLATLIVSGSTLTAGFTYTVPSATTGKNATATCPPSAAQVQAGLTNCALAVANTTATEFGFAYLNYPAQPVPAAPTVTVTPTTVTNGKVTLSGSGFWGDPDGTLIRPLIVGVATSVTAAKTPPVFHPLTTNPITIAPDTYTPGPKATSGSGGTLTGGTFAATTEKLPTGLAPGPLTYEVAEPNIAPFNDPPYDTKTTTCTSTCTGPSTANPATPPAAVGLAFNVLPPPAPTLTVTPSAGGPTTTITFTGINWTPTGTVTVAFTTACATCSGPDSTTVTASATGTISGTLTITAATGTGTGEALGTNPITATETANTASAPFTVTLNACTVTTTTCAIKQVLSTTVTGTTLGISQTSSSVTLSPITLGSQRFAASTGHLNQVTVSDDRGTLGGWTVTGQLATNFANTTPAGNTADNVIPADFLTWVPSVTLAQTGSIPADNANTTTCPAASGTCVGPSGLPAASTVTSAAIVGGTLPTGFNGTGTGTGGTSTIPAEVFAGPRAVLQNLAGTAVTLCTAPAGGGGGGFHCTATLSLSVPPYVAAGTYSATLDIVVTGL